MSLWMVSVDSSTVVDCVTIDPTGVWKKEFLVMKQNIYITAGLPVLWLWVCGGSLKPSSPEACCARLWAGSSCPFFKTVSAHFDLGSYSEPLLDCELPGLGFRKVCLYFITLFYHVTFSWVWNRLWSLSMHVLAVIQREREYRNRHCLPRSLGAGAVWKWKVKQWKHLGDSVLECLNLLIYVHSYVLERCFVPLGGLYLR